MTITEIGEKLKRHEQVSTAEVTGAQLFMLLHDHIIQTVEYQSKVWEINFIPVEQTEATILIEVNDDCCADFRASSSVIRQIVDAYEHKHTVCMNLEQELFDIELEILEVRE